MTRRFLIRRLLQVVPAVSGVVVLSFVLVAVAPGDPARDYAGEGADQAQIDAASDHLGLDRPLHEQFATYAGRLARGDLGVSYVQQRPVTELIGARLPATLLLTGTALVVSSAGGIALGIFATRRRALGRGVELLALVVYSLPAFWLGQLAILAFAIRTGLLPAGGMNDARAGYTGLSAALDTTRHLFLPALVLSASEVALLARVTRAGLRVQEPSDYARTARAKGLSEERVLSRHLLPNALLPVITVIGSRVGFLVSGAVLVESVFGWPGLGRLLVDAARAGDRPVILGMVLLVSLVVVVVNLVTDLAYACADPRIRFR